MSDFIQKIKEQIDTITISLTCVLIGVLLSLIFLKFDSIKQQSAISSPIYKQYKEEEKEAPSNDNDMSMIDIKTNLGPWIDQKIKKLEKRVDTIDHRTWLLAVITNENSVISKKVAGDSEFADKYIRFDENWKLSKMPEFLKITPEDYKKLIKSANNNPIVNKSKPKQYCR